MARTPSCTEESLASVLARSPSENLSTPAVNKPVDIKPLKRARGKENDLEIKSGTPSPTAPVDPEARVARPRRLNFDDEEVAKTPEEEEVPLTQPWPPQEEREEGELTPDP